MFQCVKSASASEVIKPFC